MRVYLWAALAAERRQQAVDHELPYTASMFHDVGLTPAFHNSQFSFEVNGANAARDFLRGHGISESDIEKVWLAIALHTTPGIPAHLHPIAALTAEGVMMDLVGLGYNEFTEAQRKEIAAVHPHPPYFAEGVLQALRRPQAPAAIYPGYRPG